eukprot:Sdes_comp10463_c0_seq1m2167
MVQELDFYDHTKIYRHFWSHDHDSVIYKSFSLCLSLLLSHLLHPFLSLCAYHDHSLDISPGLCFLSLCFFLFHETCLDDFFLSDDDVSPYCDYDAFSLCYDSDAFSPYYDSDAF